MQYRTMLDETDSKFPLPPCRICSAPGAGFHYGVNTCEACKGFFHRSLSQWTRYKCVNKGNCEVQHGKGKMCRFCRYEKCLQSGMSKSAIKTGRYNYKKKTSDILEVKRMAKQLEREKTRELTPRLDEANPGTANQREDSGDSDTIFNEKHAWAYSSLSNSTLHLQDQDSCSSEHDHHKSDSVQQTVIESGINQDQAFEGSACNSILSPDYSLQWTPDPFISSSPSSLTSDISTPTSPSLLRSSSSSPYAGSLPSVSCVERPRVHFGGSIPLQVKSPNPLDTLLDTNQKTQVEVVNSGHNFTDPFVGLPLSSSSIPKESETTHVNTYSVHDSSLPDCLRSDMPSSSKTLQIVNTMETLRIEKDSSGNENAIPSPENFSLERAPPTPWLRISESDFSNKTIDEVLETVTGDVSNIETLFKNHQVVVKNLFDAHELYIRPIFHELSPEEIEKQQREHYESCMLRKEIFGHSRRLHDHEYDQLYGATGIDADNRSKRMHDFAKAMEGMLRAMVYFANAIPGFSGLPKEIKLHLIKYSRHEFALVNLFKYVNPELKVYRGIENDWQCSLEMENSEYRRILDSTFLFLGKFQSLNLTQAECVVLRALVIMAPDRTIPLNAEGVSAIYDKLVDLLIHLFSQRLDRPMLFFAKVTSLITECRTKEDEMIEGFKKYKLIRYMPIDDKPFLQLMYSDYL